jgi:hypothetical protein
MITITPAIAAHILHHFDAGGIRAGSFTVRLVDLITHADPTNRARLALGFPGYVAAVDLAQNDLDGMTELRRIAATFGRETPTCAHHGNWYTDEHGTQRCCACDAPTTTVHMCPPDGSNTMPCCGKPPLERRADRMTLNPSDVTCSTWPNEAEPTLAEDLTSRSIDDARGGS